MRFRWPGAHATKTNIARLMQEASYVYCFVCSLHGGVSERGFVASLQACDERHHTDCLGPARTTCFCCCCCRFRLCQCSCSCSYEAEHIGDGIIGLSLPQVLYVLDLSGS